MADDPYNAAPVPMTDVRHDMPPSRDDRDSYSAPRDYPPPRNTAPPPPRPSNAPVAEPSNVLGVFGLSIRTGDRDLYEVFSGQGRRVEKALVVYDQRSGRSRGFGFVTMGSIPDAESAIAELNGIDLQGRRIRVDFSATKRPHDPTPGEYRGPRRDDDFGPPRGGPYGGPGGGGDDRWATRGGPSYGGGGYGGGGGRGRYDDPYGGDSYRAPLPSRGGDDHRWSSRDDDRSYRRSSRRADSRSRSRSPAPRRSRSPAPRRSRSRSPAPRRSRGGDDYDRDRSRSRSRSPVRRDRERSRTPVKARGRSRSPTPRRDD
ncbi:hypothetical protein BMF94_2175 [Rhodotorula taiwanensis]|uniref:RRM domain-containing protein n=1 Tax=Rhodotorula taiwanensis TaxID=741276 RepID=A0A2S5BD56_9BASI|nr:hypothetical protein BMF94_2175 [Rhodotorula taiwanensis]